MPRPLLFFDASGRRLAATRTPWRWLAAVVGLLVVADLLLTLVHRPGHEPALADDAARVHAALARAAEHAQPSTDTDDERPPEAPRSWLLLGDSVLAGDVMQSTVPDWDEHRVLDYLRREQRPGAAAHFEQVALDGMLPIDMLEVLERLDTLDPDGRVGVVVELNPRFFSQHHATERVCSRPFLCELGGPAPGRGRWAWAPMLVHESHRWLLDHLPVVRHRAWLPRLDPTWTHSLTTAAKVDKDERDDQQLLGRARVLEHYRDLALHGKAQQIAAVRRIMRRLRQRGRPALLFATPLNDTMMRGTFEPDDYGDYLAQLDRILNTTEHPQIRFVSLDHPALADAEFLDHAHLRPSGNRWLALNLLHQLGVGINEAPARGQLAYEEGVDRTLVSRVTRGSAQGAPWQAMFQRPDGVAVAPGARRIVIADTGNHALRELVGPLAITRTLAGTPGTAGDRDDTLRRATFDRPRNPTLVGRDVYVIDGNGRQRLRRISKGRVKTIVPSSGPGWRSITQLASDGHDLWLVDEGRTVLRFDPSTGATRRLLQLTGPPVAAIDVDPSGRLFFGDRLGQIWQLEAGATRPTRLFANRAPELLPQQEGDFFPFSFDEMGLDTIVGLRYVPRYDALLVQDEHQTSINASKVTERVHLRLLSLAERKIYPWVHPLAHGGGQMFHNRHSDALSSYYHLGSFDLDPQTGTLVYVERYRSRVLALSDGLLGAAKLGHHITPLAYGGLKDVFGRAAGTTTMLRHHPERWAATRAEPLPRRGPYLGLMIGSSMTAVSEGVGQYSLARVAERELTRRLGVQDGLRFDLVQRAYRGPRLQQMVDGIEAFISHQSPVDVLIIETHSGRMFGKYEDTGELAKDVDRIRLAAARYRSLVIVLDNDAMTSRKRDGLRGNTKRHLDFLELCQSAGFWVVRPSDALLSEAIDHAPWGTAPFSGSHGSPWAIELTGLALARAAYPAIREHLDGKLPALARPWAQRYAQTEPLHLAFEAAGSDWASAAADVPADALQVSLVGRHLHVVVDADRARREQPSASDEALALGSMVESIVRDPKGHLANRVTVTIVRFSSYDEYGVGVLDQGQTVLTRSLSTDELLDYLKKVAPAD